MGGSQSQGYRFGGPHNKDYSVLKSTWRVSLLLEEYHIHIYICVCHIYIHIYDVYRTEELGATSKESRSQSCFVRKRALGGGSAPAGSSASAAPTAAAISPPPKHYQRGVMRLIELVNFSSQRRVLLTRNEDGHAGVSGC